MSNLQRIMFISTMGGYMWGGSEELWADAAMYLAKSQGSEVFAGVRWWPTRHRRVHDLETAGVEILNWPDQTLSDPWTDFLEAVEPDLVIVSNGGTVPGRPLTKSLLSYGKPFANICQANHTYLFFSDDDADLFARFFQESILSAFVSKANLALLESQLGARIPNAAIVRNPVNLPDGPTPQSSDVGPEDRVIKLACVGRLHAPSKGQDILLETLSTQKWREREWTLSLFGDGPQKRVFQRLVVMYGIEDRVSFVAHRENIADIWRDHDLLVMASRYEGLPLTVVEAMLCGRPVVATDVADIKEVVDEGETGFLAEAPTVPSFDRALDRAWSQRAEWPRIGAQARSRALDFVPQEPGGEFIKLIEKAMMKPGLELEAPF
ncbi:MAG: glycosyltransferase family 4 protein [Acidobacteria bacterium]|nr:glycosyltransferase family 4 protein [Acidobacteriota bacterium]